MDLPTARRTGTQVLDGMVFERQLEERAADLVGWRGGGDNEHAVVAWVRARRTRRGALILLCTYGLYKMGNTVEKLEVLYRLTSLNVVKRKEESHREG